MVLLAHARQGGHPFNEIRNTLSLPRRNSRRSMVDPDARGVRPRARARLGVLGCFGIIVLCGCGSRRPLYAVRGEVFFKGKPAQGALVVFHPLGGTDSKVVRPRGTVEADGSFQLSSYAQGDGAAPGEYVVTINWLDLDKRKEENVPDRLKGHYTNRETSKLRIKVEAQTN